VSADKANGCRHTVEQLTAACGLLRNDKRRRRLCWP